MVTEDRNKQTATPHRPKPTLSPMVVLYGIICVLVVLVGYLLFRHWQLTSQYKEERSRTQALVQTNQLANDQQQLTLGMKTFVWAVRNAMLQNKSGEINEYFNTLVKDRGVKEVLLVDPTGKITLSTNKKNQGTMFTERFPAYLIQQQEVYFGDKSPYELSAPVTAPNKRLGTLVMFYNPAPILPISPSRN